MMRVEALVRRTAPLRSSTPDRSALGNRHGPGITLAAAAPTTDGRENPATDTSRIAPSQDRKTFKSSNLDPAAGMACRRSPTRLRLCNTPQAPRLVTENRAGTVRLSKIVLDGKRPITEGLPVLLPPPLFHACRRHYPGGGAGRCARRSLPGRWQPSPRFCRVGFRIVRFEGCSAFTRVAARMVTEPPKATLFHRSASGHGRCLHHPLRLLPAGTTVTGRDSHPLRNGAFPRRTEPSALRARLHLRRRPLPGVCAPPAAQSRLPDQRRHRHRALQGPFPLPARGEPPLCRPRAGRPRRDPVHAHCMIPRA